MTEQSPRMQLPYPTLEDDPWIDGFKSFVLALDAMGYANREDRNVILADGGTIAWDATSGVLSWSGTIRILAGITGYQWQVPAGNITIDSSNGLIGQLALVRAPGSNTQVAASSGHRVTDDDSHMAFVVRIGDILYFRTGLKLEDGQSVTSIAPGGGGGGAGSFLDTGTYSYTQAAIPVEEVVGQLTLDGSAVGSLTATLKAMVRPVFATTGEAIIRLYDMGPPGGPISARLVSEVSTTTAGGPQLLTQDLTVVSAAPGTDEILDSERMYEVRVTSTGSTGDTNYVGAAGIEVK